MISPSSGTTRLVGHRRDLQHWLGVAGDPIVVVVDRDLMELPAVARLVEAIRLMHPQTRVHAVVAGEGLPAVLSLTERVRAARTVVAVGGGTVLDLTKLAVRCCADDDAARRLTVRQRSGLVLLPYLPRSVRRLAAVPTTLGTGSEASRVAVLHTDHGRKLVMADGLQPDIALHDAELTASLGRRAVTEGALEILTRLLGPYVSDLSDQPIDDELTEALVRVIGPALGRLAGAPVASAERADRTTLARVSALSQAEWLTARRVSPSTQWWLLANELAHVTSVTKMSAVRLVLPAVWDDILAGDVRLGSAMRLRRIWHLVVRSTMLRGLSLDPVAGLLELLRRLGLPSAVRLSDEVVAATTDRVVLAWGGGLPTLRGLLRADVDSLLRRIGAADEGRSQNSGTALAAAGSVHSSGRR